MKLSVFFLVVCLQMAMASSAQTVSLTVKEAPLQSVFDSIYEQTGYEFLYNSQLLSNSSPVTIDINDASLEDVLTLCFENQPLSYVIRNKTIVIQPKSQALNDSKPQGQTRIRVTGTVTDQNGIPLNGASVIVQGTSIGVSTNFDGQYEIIVPNKESILVFSYIGYEEQEITVGSQLSINVTMKEAVGQLDEVVVSTGYWQEERKVSTGNIGKIDSEIIERQPVVNALEALQGQIAGVQIQQTSGVPGSEINIRIRGQNSLNDGQILTGDGGGSLDLPNSNEPFYVVDGVPFPSTSINGLGTFPNGSPLNTIRPSDIESIEVLKDADATAIYGSRGANGVILITTKKGKAGKTKVSLDYSMGLGKVTNRLNLLNTQQYLLLREEAITNDGIQLQANDSIASPDLFLWDRNRFTDWQETLLGGTAAQTNTNLSISGGSERTQFLFRTNYFKQTNVFNFDDSSIQSGSTHFNLNHSSSDNKFRINLSTTYTLTDNNQNAPDLSARSLTLPPNAPELFDENGDINFNDNFDNPLAFLEQEYSNKQKNFIANLVLNYEILPRLHFKSSFGYNNITTEEREIFPLASRRPEDRLDIGGSLRVFNGNVESWIVEPQLDYSKEIGGGLFKILLGGTWQSTDNTGLGVRGSQYDSDVLIRDISAAPEINILRNDFSRFRYTAIYSRINYNIKDKYILNLTGRRDGSSRFGPGKQFGYFGALGAAWIFTNERFFSDQSLLSYGKLRGSYGVVGNDQIGDYQFLSTYSAVATDATDPLYNGESGLVRTRAANPDFSWEEVKKLEMGLELGFLRNRIRLNTSWFRNRSDNQLIGRPLSSVTGFQSVQFNLPALVENRGVEIELNTVNFNTNRFQWTSALNFTRYRNELLEFQEIERFSPFDNTYEVGRSLFGRKWFQTTGLNPETGDFDFVDFNGDGRIGVEDQQDFVEVFQDYFAGLNNSLRFMDFEFAFSLQFVKQNAFGFVESPGLFGNQTTASLERWQQPGDFATIPRSSRLGRRSINGTNASLTDASFLRLQNLSLAWNIPEKYLKELGMSTARIYLNGQNLLTFTSFEGFDPETGFRSLPPLRIITTGIQLNF